MKPVAHKNIRNRRIEGYTLDMAGVSGSGKTAKNAVADWQEQAAKQEQHKYTDRYDFCTDGAVFHLSYRDGWTYDIARPTSLDVAPCHGRASSCHLGRMTYPEALEKYLRHFAQYNDLRAYNGVPSYDSCPVFIHGPMHEGYEACDAASCHCAHCDVSKALHRRTQVAS